MRHNPGTSEIFTLQCFFKSAILQMLQATHEQTKGEHGELKLLSAFY